jgi:hypothetical protein
MKPNKGKALSGSRGSTSSLGMVIMNIDFVIYICLRVARSLVWMLLKALFHVPHNHYLPNSHATPGPIIKGIPMVMIIGNVPYYHHIHVIDRANRLMSLVHPRTANHMQR